MKNSRAGFLVAPTEGGLFNNRVRDEEMEEAEVHASTLPAIRFVDRDVLNGLLNAMHWELQVK